MEKRKITCPYCGAENENSERCQYCGKQIYIPSSPLTKSEQQERERKEMDRVFDNLTSVVKISSEFPLSIRFYFVYSYDVEIDGKTHKSYRWDKAVMRTLYDARLALVCDEETFLLVPYDFMSCKGCYLLTQEQVHTICEAKEILMRFEFKRNEGYRNYVLTSQEIALLQAEARLLYHCKWDGFLYQDEFAKAEKRLQEKEEVRQEVIEKKKQSMRQKIIDEKRNRQNYIQDGKSEIPQETQNKREIHIIIAAILLVSFALAFLFFFFDMKII